MPSFFSLFILLLHLSCFTFHGFKKKKKTPPHPNPNPKKTLFSFLKTLFSNKHPHPHPPPSIPSPPSSTRSFHSIPFLQEQEPISNIHPCTTCGEICSTLFGLQHHQSTKHAITELLDGENILRIIFKMGWPNKPNSVPTIHRILKIHNCPNIIARFEEYRDSVKAKAAAELKTVRGSDNERCIADGNELLRFYATTFVCGLSSGDGGGICSHHYCTTCRIVRSGFSDKTDGISTFPTSWSAHVTIPEDFELEFGYGFKRALLVCRVISGRIGSDSLVIDGLDGGELVVYNQWAVLPCFVIVYAV